MKTYEVGAQKGADSLRLVDRPEPKAAAGQAVVRIKANSINFRDVMVQNGWYGPAKPETTVPFSDGAGEVVSVGEGVTRVKPGDRVAISFFSRWIDGPFGPQYFGSDLGGGADGTLTELGAYPADALVKIPDNWTFEEAACLPCAGVTAWNAIVEAGKAKAGDTVLLIGTGGVSIFGVQIAKALGLKSVITSSSDEKLARAKSLGADAGVNYKTNAEWPKAVLEATGGKGADIVVETAGPGNLDNSFAAAAFNGRIGLIGGFEQAKTPPNVMPLVGKNLNLRGITVGSRKMMEDLIAALVKSNQKPVIDKVVDFANAKEAHALMQSQKHLGKIVIKH
ncbi:MAG: NAD(P)-dependent alcohol dehydrogenase [Rhodospirillaceae bacterium]|nr:NAD(P)-dependent alcohol dehydrogenase [Rhodospirillaceae bacterium]